MTVDELLMQLYDFPKDMEVIVVQHSDYVIIDCATVIGAVRKDHYVMRAHGTMQTENFLLIQ